MQLHPADLIGGAVLAAVLLGLAADSVAAYRAARQRTRIDLTGHDWEPGPHGPLHFSTCWCRQPAGNEDLPLPPVECECPDPRLPVLIAGGPHQAPCPMAGCPCTLGHLELHRRDCPRRP